MSNTTYCISSNDINTLLSGSSSTTKTLVITAVTLGGAVLQCVLYYMRKMPSVQAKIAEKKALLIAEKINQLKTQKP